MRPHRVNILGASGCGATTLARAVAAALGVPHFDVDDYYHLPTDPPFQAQRDPQDRHDLLVTDLGRSPGWALSGGLAGWSPYPRLDLSLMVFLWVPADVRMERLRQRERARYGARVLPGGDMHAASEDFLAWASRYDAGDVDGKTRARHEAYLAEQVCPVLRIEGAVSTPDALARVVARIGRPS